MAEDEIRKHAKAAYDTLVDKEKDWRHKFKDILLEIGIIVFAVTISIWLHNWSEAIKDQHAEKEFLQGLKGDIKADLSEMRNDRTFAGFAFNGVRYFEKVGAGVELDKDSMAKYVAIFFSQTQINPRIARYEALKSSGKLDIIANKKLQYDIINLYEKDFPHIFRNNDFNNKLIADKLAVYFSDNIQLGAKGEEVNAQEVLRKSKMRILLREAEGLYNAVGAYTKGMDMANEIVKEIDAELK
ncbi:MAG: DUF6090 family protein [Sphingobacteriales bacterium]